MLLRETSPDPGGGLVCRISNDEEPQFPVVCVDLPCPAGRNVAAYCMEAVRPLGLSQKGVG